MICSCGFVLRTNDWVFLRSRSDRMFLRSRPGFASGSREAQEADVRGMDARDSKKSFFGLTGEDFGEVLRAGGGVLGDLFAAAEAVADDGGGGVVADGGEEDALA
jgi:hypothetical protein